MVARMPEYYGYTVGSAGVLIRRVLLSELHGARAWREVESQPLPDLARFVAELNLVSDNPNLNPNTEPNTRDHNWHAMQH